MPMPNEELDMNAINEQIVARRVRGVRTFGLIVSVALVLLVAFGRGSAYVEAREMFAQGVATEAVVVQRKHWVESGRKGREYDRYALIYRFSDSDGRVFDKEIRVSESTYLDAADPSTAADADAATSAPTRLDVLYRRTDPTTSDLRQNYERKASLLRIAQDLLLTLAIALAATFLIAFLTGRRLRRRMLQAQPAN